MSDYDIVPRKAMVKYGSRGFGGVAGGLALFFLNGMGFIPSLIVGGILTVVGLVLSGDKDDKTAGMLTTAAGVLTCVTAIPLIGGLAGFLLAAAGTGLVIMGGLNIFKFFKGYKKRR